MTTRRGPLPQLDLGRISAHAFKMADACIRTPTDAEMTSVRERRVIDDRNRLVKAAVVPEQGLQVLQQFSMSQQSKMGKQKLLAFCLTARVLTEPSRGFPPGPTFASFQLDFRLDRPMLLFEGLRLTRITQFCGLFFLLSLFPSLPLSAPPVESYLR